MPLALRRPHARLVALASVFAFGVLGCSCSDDKTDETPGEKKGAATAEKAAPKTLAAGALKAPAHIVAYGGTGPLAPTLKGLHGLASKVVPAPAFDAMAAPALQGELRLKDANAIDTSKPFRFAFVNPREHRAQPLVLLVPTTGQAAFEKSLPDTKTKGEKGNAWTYTRFENDPAPIFVAFAGDVAVITRDAAVYPLAAEFVGQLARAKMPAPVSAFVEVDHLIAIYAKEFDRDLNRVRKFMADTMSAAPGGSMQADAFDAMFDWMGRSAKQLERVRVELRHDDAGVQLHVVADPKTGSELEKTLSTLAAPGRAGLIGKLPADTVALAVGDLDSAAWAEHATALLENFSMKPIFGDQMDQAKPYVAAMKDYMKAITGDFVLAAHPAPGDDGLALTGLFGVKDAAAARAAQQAMTGMYTDPAAQAYYEKLGVKLTFQRAAYQAAGVDVDVIKSEMGKIEGQPPQAAQVAGMLEGLMTQHIAIGPEFGVMAYGNEGKAGVEAFLNGTVAGGLDKSTGVQRALKYRAPKSFMWMYVNPIETARRLKLGGMNPFAAALGGIEAKTGLTMSFGIDDGALHFATDVPIEMVKGGMAAFEKSKGAF